MVNLDLQMDQDSALEAARKVAQEYNLGPQGYKQAASFEVNDAVQYYVELEVGGSEAFQKLIKDGLYSPYTWNVRHFKEGEVNESEIRFSPSGQSYGISEWLSEDAPGASLTQDEALKIAKTKANYFENINLREYELIDKSQKVRPSGRIDHTFVYERPTIRIGEGRYRLSLEISGDKLTELVHYIKIPEEFFLKYKEMRSANETIAEIANYVMYFLYVLVGGCFGLFYLLRKRLVIWKAPLFCGLFVASLQALSSINAWPVDWMYYDTAISTQVYILEKIVGLTKSFLFDLFLLTISFMAAESLTRKAFPNQIQFWRLHSAGVANSREVLGRTVGGYLLVGLDLSFLIGLYFFSTKVLGWWTPSGVLFEPDILATYIPWLSPIADSLKAGFWEESLCRAVPIAGAALIGQKLGKRRLFIIGALVFQAILFGALHTNYAGQPSYARLVELIIPSVVYGLIYLRFGLLPCIILHFVYDAVLMSLPLFVSSAQSVLIDKIFVVVLVLAPIGIIFLRRLQKGEWSKLETQNSFNSDWQPSSKNETSAEIGEVKNPKIITPKTFRWFLCAGILGLVVWFYTADLRQTPFPLQINRTKAEILAQKALNDRGVSLDESWLILSTVKVIGKESKKFIKEVGGKNVYNKLMGTYLHPPLWKVRFAKFEGDITERAEEYNVYVLNDTNIVSIYHKLPENRSGAFLNSDQAKKIAYDTLKSKYNLSKNHVKEIGAESDELPSRKDWTFIFSDIVHYQLKTGEARININIAGDEVVTTFRYIHLPEDWKRKYQNKESLKKNIDNFGYNFLLFLVIAASATAVIIWSRKNYSAKAFFYGFAILFVICLLRLVNEFPGEMAEFSTIEPLTNQYVSEITSSLFALILAPLIFGLLFGLTQAKKDSQSSISGVKASLIGVSLGTIFVSVNSLLKYLMPSDDLSWIDYSAADSYFPVLQASLEPLESFIIKTISFILLFLSIDRLTKGWTVRRILISSATIVFSLAYVAVLRQDISLWLLQGIFSGIILLLFYIFVFRNDISIIPITSAAISILALIQVGAERAYSGAVPGALITIVIIGSSSFYLLKKMSNSSDGNNCRETETIFKKHNLLKSFSELDDNKNQIFRDSVRLEHE